MLQKVIERPRILEMVYVFIIEVLPLHLNTTQHIKSFS